MAFIPMTYSIAALDQGTGEIGVAVASCWPAVGAVVPWVEPRVGAVVTQSFTNVDLGPAGLALLRDGMPAPAVVRKLLDDDPDRDTRQLGVVDAHGRAAAHSGDRCVAEAGHTTADGVAALGNMLDQPGIPRAMLRAFVGASGDLSDRLVDALVAGERGGGDVRGRLSSALLVAPGSGEAQPWDRRFDLRVDASAGTLEDLGRLLRLARAYEALELALAAADAGRLEAAVDHAGSAYELAPGEAQVALWRGVLLSATGRVSEARPLLDAALRSEPRLEELGRRFAAAGHGASVSEVLRELGASQRRESDRRGE